MGRGGAVHAFIAPLATRLIDRFAYGGRDVRAEVLEDVHGSVVDLCCGVGMSTKAGGVGIDTSPQMVAVAKSSQHATFHVANAEDFGSDDTYDVATLMFGLHEMPREARLTVIANAMRIAMCVVIVDIAAHYQPSKTMLSGEPYLPNYLEHIHSDVEASASDTWDISYAQLAPTLVMWNLTRT